MKLKWHEMRTLWMLWCDAQSCLQSLIYPAMCANTPLYSRLWVRTPLGIRNLMGPRFGVCYRANCAWPWAGCPHPTPSGGMGLGPCICCHVRFHVYACTAGVARGFIGWVWGHQHGHGASHISTFASSPSDTWPGISLYDDMPRGHIIVHASC